MSELELPSLIALGESLERAEHDRARRARVRRRSLLVGIGVATTLGVGAAAGTALLLRAAVIPAPSPEVVGPAQSPIPGSARVEALRAPDPGGAAPWTLRVARSRTGLTCTTVGQVVGGRFGVVGLDGRFRVLAEGIVDGCGHVEPGSAMAGARIFDARRRADVRTVVSGDAGPDLRDVVVRADGRRLDVQRGSGGTFAVVLRGYPEDHALAVTLRYRTGRVERHGFGLGPDVVPDPDGGPAWRLESEVTDRHPHVVCVSFRPARPVGPTAISPGACGRDDERTFFAIERITAAGDPPRFGYGAQRWDGHPPRTAVWGKAGREVRSVQVLGPGGTQTRKPGANGQFLVLFGPGVDPRDVRVRLTDRDGGVREYTTSTTLIDPEALP
jgi:hypothetical protein